jgi:hypothetical protein
MATCPRSLPVQYGVETERKNNKLKTASSGRKNGEPLTHSITYPGIEAAKRTGCNDRRLHVKNVLRIVFIGQNLLWYSARFVWAEVLPKNPTSG